MKQIILVELLRLEGENDRLEEVESYEQLEEIIEKADWRRFEEIVGKLFKFHGYSVKVGNVVTFENTKRQYDVIAEKEYCIVVDCKKWDNKRRIKHGLKVAVKDQIERVKKLTRRSDKYPVIVLSNKAPLEQYKRVPVIPIYKLNTFISNFSHHEKNILRL